MKADVLVDPGTAPMFIRASTHGKWHRVVGTRSRWGRVDYVAACGYSAVIGAVNTRTAYSPEPGTVHLGCAE